MTNYTQAPLPFQGQKRRFLKDFKEALKNYSPTATYVDLFGGSGLLSHTVKQVYPDAVVVYNDFDGYKNRLKKRKNLPANCWKIYWILVLLLVLPIRYL